MVVKGPFMADLILSSVMGRNSSIVDKKSRSLLTPREMRESPRCQDPVLFRRMVYDRPQPLFIHPSVVVH